MNEMVKWMDSKGIPLDKVVIKLKNKYPESEVIYASNKVYKTLPDIKPIRLFWKIKDILDTRPYPDYAHRVDRISRAIRLMDRIPWYTKPFGRASAIGVW